MGTILDILEEMEKVHSQNKFVIDYNNNKIIIDKDSDEKATGENQSTCAKRLDIKQNEDSENAESKESISDLENMPVKSLAEEVKVKQEVAVPDEKYDDIDENEILILSSDDE